MGHHKSLLSQDPPILISGCAASMERRRRDNLTVSFHPKDGGLQRGQPKEVRDGHFHQASNQCLGADLSSLASPSLHSPLWPLLSYPAPGSQVHPTPSTLKRSSTVGERERTCLNPVCQTYMHICNFFLAPQPQPQCVEAKPKAAVILGERSGNVRGTWVWDVIRWNRQWKD